jgi:ferredoxin
MKVARRIVQGSSLVFVAAAVFLVKGNAERWCPFGGVETLYTYWTEGNLICSLGMSNLYILAGVVGVTLLFRRAFCGYLCPVGTISEWIGRGARRLGLKAFAVPYRLDRGLALLKYGILGLILFLTWRAGELYFRTADPCYALISRHGEDITFWAYVVAGGIVVFSAVLILPFCRWFCPLAGVLNIFSRFGFTRVKRNAQGCIHCGACARNCPMAIPVDTVSQVTAARCLSCLNCVASCPTQGDKTLIWGPPRWIGGRWPQAVLIGLMLAGISSAVAAAYIFPVASFIKVRGVAPGRTESVELKINNLTCRGRANLLVYYLERDDEFAVRGYLKLEAWPGPGFAEVRVTFDPAQANPQTVRQAILEPYYDPADDTWRFSPFEIHGFALPD